MERALIQEYFGGGSPHRIELCGFGLVAAAARTSQLIAAHSPARIVLLGIAGSLSDELLVGQAYCFGKVACYGIGAGSGDRFLSADEMGWKHWSCDAEIGDLVVLHETVPNRLLLSCCAASGQLSDVRHKLEKYPHAQAEDMEGFAVATACQMTGTPLTIIRGISNRAGDRDPNHWLAEAALHATARLCQEMYVL